MSTRVRVDPRAADELDEAANWYDAQRAGLGREFVLEVREAVRALAREPQAGSPVDVVDATLGIRRVRVRRFPYQVVYVTLTEHVVVIAVAHDRRRPGYWAQRIGADG